MVALPPDVVRWIARNGEDDDCAIAAISLATGETYERVLATAGPAAVDGLTLRQLRGVVSQLGYTTRLRRKYDVEKDTGILWCHGLEKKQSDHVVYLWAGRVVEPALGRRALWLDPEAYLVHEKFKAGYLIVIEKEEEHA